MIVITIISCRRLGWWKLRWWWRLWRWRWRRLQPGLRWWQRR